jgi:hypothetical protein
VGLGALSLWPLDELRQFLGMVAWTGRLRLPSTVGPGLCVVLWIRRWRWSRIRIRRLRLVAHRSLRYVLPLVGRVRWPLWSGEHHQHQHNQYQSLRRHRTAAQRSAIFEPGANQRSACWPRDVDRGGKCLRCRSNSSRGSKPRSIAQRAHDDGQSACSPIACELVSQRARSGAGHGAWHGTAFLR